MLQNYIKKILTAPVYDVAIQSPLEYAPLLSKRTGHKIWLKREDLQSIFSFKIRGAYNKIAGLDEKVRQRGVVTASAGNHAQGVALSAKHFKIPAIICMPAPSPEIKIKAVQSFGAEVILHGDVLAETYAYAQALAKKRGLVFIHPYDDPDVIAGQGTIGMEILRQHSGAIDAIFVPIGGGGLIAGIAAYVKFARPEVKIIGIEPEGCDCMYQAIKAGKPVPLEHIDTFADGVAVKQAGKETFRIVRKYVDEILHVNNDEICAAIKDIFVETRSVAEPSGALGVAAIKKYTEKYPNRKARGDFVAIVSGANMNFDRLRYVAERTATGEKREMLLAVTLPEKPGGLRKFCTLIGKRNFTEFNYRFFSPEEAQVFIGIQMQNYQEEGPIFIKKLKSHGFPAVDLTENELAKEHVRFMVGGRPPKLADEVLYRFEFPERTGALLNFLTKMDHTWNVSLFHCRNQGAAWVHALVGLQVPKNERNKLKKFISEVGIAAFDETDNPAYKVFLRN